MRVYNNSTIEGLAAQAAADFETAGWTVTEAKGYPFGTIPTSTVYYRPETSEVAAAEALANQFGLRSEPRFEGIQGASAGLIVIVTKDYQRR
ncbi:MAG: LytR C-terminal domain-containing protein [Pseudonocardia sp.]